MKKLLLIPLLLILVAACTNQSRTKSSPALPASGVPRADSMFNRLERMKVSTQHQRAQINALSDSFCRLAAEYPSNRLLQMRRTYVAGCTLAGKDHRALAQLLDTGMIAADSALYPFDWHLLRTLRLNIVPTAREQYRQASANAAYFASVGSKMGEAMNDEWLGRVWLELYDKKLSDEYYTKAINLYHDMGASRREYLAEMSRDAAIEGDIDTAKLMGMLRDPVVQRDPVVYSRALWNAYVLLDSVPLLYRAISVLQSESVDRSNMPVMLAMRAFNELNNGHSDSALRTVEEIKEEYGLYEPPLRDRSLIHSAIAYVYQTMKMYDEAIDQMCMVVSWTDSLYKHNNLPAMYAAETARLIETENNNARLLRQRILLWWGISIASLLALVGWLVLFFRRRQARNKYEIKLLENKIDNAYRTCVAQSGLLRESRSLMADIESAIDRAGGDNAAEAPLKIEIRRILAMHMSREDSREGMLKVSEELDSGFASALKRDFPDLSESLLRLAAFIAAGIDNHQLSAILNISPKSLYTSRYRLRSRLKLEKDASLEDFLRRYTNRPDTPKDTDA